MWVRIARDYQTAYTPQVLAEYRGHSSSISSQKQATGQALQDLKEVIDRIHDYLPTDRKDRITRISRKYYALYGLNIAFQRWNHSGNFRNLCSSIYFAFRLYSGYVVYLTIVKLFFKVSIKFLFRHLYRFRMRNDVASGEKWEWEITSKTTWKNFNLMELWAYRSLLFRLIRRDYLVSYQQTLLGPLWSLVQPILTVATYVLVFGNFIRISTGEIPPALFYLSGTILWGLFNDVFTGVSSTFTDNADLFSKVYFPRLVMPLAWISSQLIRLFFQMTLLIAGLVIFYVFFDLPVALNASILFIPIVLLGITGLGMGLGLLVAVATAKYRDLLNIIVLVMRMLLFVTPVFYPLEIVSKRVQWVVLLNPLTSMFELFRYALFGQGTFTTLQVFYSFFVTFSLLLLGILLFNKKKEIVMDTI